MKVRWPFLVTMVGWDTSYFYTTLMGSLVENYLRSDNVRILYHLAYYNLALGKAGN